MEFLPVRMNGIKVYAGFWQRFFAGFIDFLIIIPLGFLFVWLKSFDIKMAIAITILSSILVAMYNVFFNARFGGTLGKLVAGIRITKPDGSRIGWSEAWKRSSIDLFFAFGVLLIQVWVLTQVDPSYYVSLAWNTRIKFLHSHYPAWYKPFTTVQQIWIWSEVIVLLFNKRKRAIHDFIAGTVVIKREFAESVSVYNKLSEQKEIEELSDQALVDEVLS